MDKYAFRFNRRLSTHRGKLFYRLIEEGRIKRSNITADDYLLKRRTTTLSCMNLSQADTSISPLYTRPDNTRARQKVEKEFAAGSLA
ncbi:MAG: hypothetical protein D3924_00600 [Candidatus Electrothrix sp. AR4]|nr:hypothetical protein [Candidatus Electrothrix sp. AR4]